MTNEKTLPKTHWKKLYNPNYLGAWSLEEGKDIILTIKSVALEMVTGSDGKKYECTVIKWVQNQKPMILNKTNAKTIAKLCDSPYIEDWPNTSIQLYADKVKAFGDIVEALRIRPRLPQMKKELLTPDHKHWNRALKAVQDGNTTVAIIRSKFNLSDQHAKLLQGEKVA